MSPGHRWMEDDGTWSQLPPHQLLSPAHGRGISPPCLIGSDWYVHDKVLPNDRTSQRTPVVTPSTTSPGLRGRASEDGHDICQRLHGVSPRPWACLTLSWQNYLGGIWLLSLLFTAGGQCDAEREPKCRTQSACRNIVTRGLEITFALSMLLSIGVRRSLRPPDG